MSKKAALIGSHFPTIYLTVISLLQGIALSQLVPNIITYVEIVDKPLSNIYILPLALMLLIIFIAVQRIPNKELRTYILPII